MEFINFGKVVNVSASVPTAIDDATYHIIIDFVPDDPNIFDDFHDNMDEILKHPDYYVLCNIEDIVKVNGEIQNLREQRIKEKQAFEDRIKELEGQLADAKKESDKKLCEAYMETNAALHNSVYRLIAIEKELAESKTFAEVEYKWQSDGSFTVTYTKCDGTKQVVGMDLSESVDATSISCGTVPKCKSCNHFMHNPSRFAHDWCYMPVAKESGAGYIRKLNKEEAEGPACDKFEARKEN